MGPKQKTIIDTISTSDRLKLSFTYLHEAQRGVRGWRAKHLRYDRSKGFDESKLSIRYPAQVDLLIVHFRLHAQEGTSLPSLRKMGVQETEGSFLPVR